MPGVRLFFTVDVTFSPLSKGTTRWNTPAREPVLQVASGTSVVVPAQVFFIARRAPGFTSRAGVVQTTTGYLVVLVDDLERLEYTPARGDRIVDIPGEDGIYYITRIDPRAHKFGRNQTLHLSFEDRAPVAGG